MTRPAPSYASSYKPRGSYVSQGQRRPPATAPTSVSRAPPISARPDPNHNTDNSTLGKVTRPQKSILQTVPIRADSNRGRERSYLNGTLTTRNKLRPKSPHHKAKSPEPLQTKIPKQALPPWDKEVPLGSTVPGPILVPLPTTSEPEVPQADSEQVPHDIEKAPMIDHQEIVEKGIIEEEVFLLSEELLALVPDEIAVPQSSLDFEKLENPAPTVRECLTQDLTKVQEFEDEPPIYNKIQQDLNAIDDQVNAVLYFSSKYFPQPQIDVDTPGVSDEEVLPEPQLEQELKLEVQKDVHSLPSEVVQAYSTNNNDELKCYPGYTTQASEVENSELEPSDNEVEPVKIVMDDEEKKDAIQETMVETPEEPVHTGEESNFSPVFAPKPSVEQKTTARKPEAKNPRELKFTEDQMDKEAKRHTFRSKSADRNSTSKYSQLSQNRNRREFKLSEQYPTNGPSPVLPSTSKSRESAKKDTYRVESKPKPREASRSRLKSDLKPKQKVGPRKNNVEVSMNQEGPEGDVKCAHTVLLHDLGKAVVGTLRFRNISDESVLFRVTAVKDDIPFLTDPKEGQLGSGKSVVVKLQCTSVSKFARISEQTFKIETIRLSVKNALNLSLRNWMHCKSTKAVFTTSNLMLNKTSSILRHYAANLDNEKFQPSKPPERKQSINVHSLLLDIQKGQAENQRIHWYQKMHFVLAAVLACAGCVWLSPIEPASFSRMISS